MLFALLLLFAVCSLPKGALHAQPHRVIVADTQACTPEDVKRHWVNNIFQNAWNSIQRNPDDVCNGDPEFQILNARAEDMFKPFAGKVIFPAQWDPKLGIHVT